MQVPLLVNDFLRRAADLYPDKLAIVDGERRYTYRDFRARANQLSRALTRLGIQKGDRVCIYMPMIVEAAYAMLACARIGAIHSIVFAGFSAEALKDRIENAQCSVLITADESVRGGKTVPLKLNADIAARQCPSLHTVLTVRRTGADVDMSR